MTTGIFPRRWRIPRLALLRKENKPLDDHSSYRPICLLDKVGKFLEILLVHRLEAHIQSKSNLSNAQYGFRRGLSKVDAALALRNMINCASTPDEILSVPVTCGVSQDSVAAPVHYCGT